MQGQKLAAIYLSRSQAEAARSALLENGVSAADIRLSSEQDNNSAPAGEAPQPEVGFLDWLFGADTAQNDRASYISNLRDGRTALSVHVHGEGNQGIIDLLEQFDPIAMEGLAQTSQTGIEEGEQVIPVTREELEVGKRETERRYRVRTYAVERPVEQDVQLRDERVVIERRPASGGADVSGGAFQEREFEVVERHEEPMVAKKVGAVEEVVVHKDVSDRRETVRETVRETKVDADPGAEQENAAVGDFAAAGNKPSSSVQPNRKP
jgi:stress response protein YsnF